MDFLCLPPPLRRRILHRTTINTLCRNYALTTTPTPTTTTTAIPQAPTPTADDILRSLSSYVTAVPPNSHELRFAASFFHASPPILLYTSAKFRELPPSSFPELVFLGRSNVGKSSLLNSLFGRTTVKSNAHVSSQPGHTRTMNGYGVAGGLPMGLAPAGGEKDVRWKRFPRGGLVVMDMPGYGSHSRREWGVEITKVLEKRTQLRRTFVLVDAEHGLKKTDFEILKHLRRSGLSHSIILSKADKLLSPGSRAPTPDTLMQRFKKLEQACKLIRHRLDEDANDKKKGMVDILVCSANKSLVRSGSRGANMGIDHVRWAALSACGLECDEFGKKKGAVDVQILGEEPVREDAKPQVLQKELVRRVGSYAPFVAE